MKAKKGRPPVGKKLPQTFTGIVNSLDYLWNQQYTFQKFNTRSMIDAFLGYVYIAVTIIADSAAALPLVLHANPARGRDEDKIKVIDHPFWDMIYEPNPYMSYYDLKYITFVFLELTGNAFWWIVPNALGVPAQVEPLLPHRTIVRVINGQVTYTYMPLGGGSIMLDPKRVIHFKFPSPLTHFYGFSPLEAIGTAVNLKRASEDYDYARLKNNNIPPFFLTQDIKVMDIPTFGAEAKAFQDKWAQYHSGVENNQPGILPPGFTPIQLDSKAEMHSPELKKDAMNEIMAAYRVPLMLAGMSDQQGLNKAVAETIEHGFLKHTIKPKTDRFEETVERFLLNSKDPNWYPARGKYYLDLDFEYPDMRDKEFDLQVSQTLRDYLTVDQVLVMNGLEPIGGLEGGKILRSMAVNEVIPGQEPEPEPEPTPEPPQDTPPATPEPGQEPSKPKMKALDKPAVWKAFAARTEAHEGEFKKSMKGFFEDQKQEVLKKIDHNHGKLAGKLAGVSKKKASQIVSKSLLPDTFLFDMARANRRILETALPQIIGCHNDFRLKWLRELNPKAPQHRTMKAAVDYVGQKLNKGRLEGINQTTRDALQATLREGYIAGESIDDLKRRVEDVYEGCEGYRAQMIARTEIISAANAGSIDGMKESGVVDDKEWLAALDERTRDSHAAANGQVVALEDKFEVGGEQLEYPGDPDGSAEETIACRCAVIPIVKGGEE
jgi:HK97 family phage portal protein